MFRVPAAAAVLILVLSAPVAAQTNWTFTVDTYAGHYPLGDNGPATQALLSFPESAASDGAGNVYIADSWNPSSPQGRAQRRHYDSGRIDEHAA